MAWVWNRTGGWVCLAGMLVLLRAGKAGGAEDTNTFDVSYSQYSLSPERMEFSQELGKRFLQSVVTSDDMVFDRFASPSARWSWNRREDRMGYNAIGQFNSDGARLFGNIGLDSLRMAAISALPVEIWQDDWEGWLANSVVNSIGNPEEEHVELTSVSYSAMRNSWERTGGNSGIRWGFRPWRTNPYIYFLAHAGRLGNRPLLTFEGRAGYSLFDSMKVECRLTLQLTERWRVASGASLDPSKAGSSDARATHFAVSLERIIPTLEAATDSVFYIGFRSGVNGATVNPRHESLLIAGLSRRW
jgi:hypothetical protein